VKKNVFLPVIALMAVFILSSSKPVQDTVKIKNDIQTVLNRQKTAWNEGNIEGFMEDYWKSKNFTFQSGNKRLYGWDALLSRYRTSYSGENMGKLDFTDIKIKVMSNSIAYVLGRWKLKFKDSSKEGLFTIIFQRMPEGWKIIHDHSS